MLTQPEYNQLPLPQKADLLRRHGQHLLNRESPPYTVSLYSVGNFFVEAYYSQSKYYKGGHELRDLLSIRTQNGPCNQKSPLEHYLDQIDLHGLI
ncbi:hypothetical protein [Larkinella arboricola]|uniref:Uncharacterized protein n=1 Tax=Larkinella arboricola TaxID=643671 RepID=A0A327WL95_LARAB|nr:hypothetical protein [Larkinella arboricola]RAJ92619.1 hypothetical protein LX87_04949 [Larkinella arboricola]